MSPNPTSWPWHRTLFLLLALILACNQTIPTSPQPTETQILLGQVTEQDLARARSFGEELPDPEAWETNISITENRIAATWTHTAKSIVVYLDRRIYAEPYTEDTVARYYSRKNFREALLRDYEDVRLLGQCKRSKAKLRLYEFSAHVWEREYLVRYWVHFVDDTRIEDVVLAFPKDDKDTGEAIAQALFPTLPHCR